MSEVLKKFGRYFLLDRIAQGGMAEIYRARIAAPDSGSKLLVIKRIQTGFGTNAEFVTMFKSEIKVTMGFNHPNIVQVYDFGEEQEQPYIAMELVDGKNLRQFLSRFAEIKGNFPIDLAGYISEQAAGGLHYAHAFKDKISGEPLNVIHRDISPQNILISFEGNVKVIDFGIAKATTNSEHTRDGIIKGKPSYLSPEQISGAVLDARADIFAMGTVIWELLTGKKLFSGESDLAVLKLIESCSSHVRPPSSHNPDVPKELDYIVLKALAKQREMRYQSAEELRRALHKFVYTYNPDFNPSDLAYSAKDLFKNEIVEDRKRIQRLNEKAEQLLTTGPNNSNSSATSNQAGSEVKLVGKASTGRRGEDNTTVLEVRDKDHSQPQEIAKGTAKGPAARVEFETEPNPSARPPRAVPGPSRPNSAPAHNTMRAPQQLVQRKRSSIPASWIAVAALGIGVALYGKDFQSYFSTGPVRTLATQAGGAELSFEPASPSEVSKDVKVLLNGRVVATSIPVKVQVPAEELSAPIKVSVTRPDGGRFTQSLSLEKGQKKSLSVRFDKKNDPRSRLAITGKSTVLHLNISPVSSGAIITVNGAPVDPTNPLLEVPLDEHLELVIERPGYKGFQKEFAIPAEQLGSQTEWPMEVQLEPIRYGYLTIRTTPSADAVLVLRDAVRTPSSEIPKPLVKKTPFENEKVPIGTYSVRLVNEVLGMEKTEVISVQEGKVINLDVKLPVKN